MAPRANPPPKKNRARFGVKFSLKIIKGDLPPDTEYLDDDFDENLSTLAVADVDINEGHVAEHHLQAALATTAVFIPTPCSLSSVDNYDQLYGATQWKDPITYLQSNQTVEEACANALVDHDYTYYMDEFDKQWLDKNNKDARGEGTSSSARSSRKNKEKESDMCTPAEISEDEFEVVMSLMEKYVDQKILRGDAPDFEFFTGFFLEPLSPSLFASFSVPSWIPPPAQLVRIARTIYPHWRHRRTLVSGRRIQPALNFDESDFPNESYICFRRRDNKPVRKTRGGLVVNHAEKLANLQHNLSQVLDIANSVLQRENIKQSAASESQALWNARQPMADFLRQFPAMMTKADEDRLTEKPKKIKPAKSSLLPKVKVLPPTQSSSPAQAPAPPAVQPSERHAEVQQDIARRMLQETENLKRRGYLDLTDDPVQSAYLPRPEKLWVDVASKTSPPPELATRIARPLRLRVGRGGRQFIDRRSSSHPYLSPLRNHRSHADSDDSLDFDEEATRRLRAQWRFDTDSSWTGGPSEEDARELVDEFDDTYIVHRLQWSVESRKAEPSQISDLSLVSDASLTVQTPDGRSRKALPFLTNAIHLATVQNYPDVHSYLIAAGVAKANPQPTASAQAQAMAHARAVAQQRQDSSALSHQTPTTSAAPIPASVSSTISTPISARPRTLRDAPLPHPLPNGTGNSNAGGQAHNVVKSSIPLGNASHNQNQMPPPLAPTQMTNGRAIYVPSLAAANASFKVPVMQRATTTSSPVPIRSVAVNGDSK
ncbi:Enhancer of polycomb-like protein [Mycena indigotica]|uniref:Enhancer of polycomb-like protein n=1 Tax=Mycena indigotica TaxID=2126181 RepID=A0A8H6SE58_9AGAR|nr:Enhancer of polycomb-like protein [Mycena indigotica]KAF7297293.1 Enhancer of polycomb-like protein [Mycena indigotica]